MRATGKAEVVVTPDSKWDDYEVHVRHGILSPHTRLADDVNVVAVDQDGNFQKVINVFPGKTTITVRVVNKFSKQTQKSVEIEVKAGT